jgi:hypothetical protein
LLLRSDQHRRDPIAGRSVTRIHRSLHPRSSTRSSATSPRGRRPVNRGWRPRVGRFVRRALRAASRPRLGLVRLPEAPASKAARRADLIEIAVARPRSSRPPAGPAPQGAHACRSRSPGRYVPAGETPAPA